MDGWIFHLSSHLLDEITDETFCLSERHQCNEMMLVMISSGYLKVFLKGQF